MQTYGERPNSNQQKQQSGHGDRWNRLEHTSKKANTNITSLSGTHKENEREEDQRIPGAEY